MPFAAVEHQLSLVRGFGESNTNAQVFQQLAPLLGSRLAPRFECFMGGCYGLSSFFRTHHRHLRHHLSRRWIVHLRNRSPSSNESSG
jgi:hypothetical protein